MTDQDRRGHMNGNDVIRNALLAARDWCLEDVDGEMRNEKLADQCQRALRAWNERAGTVLQLTDDLRTTEQEVTRLEGLLAVCRDYLPLRAKVEEARRAEWEGS